MIISSLENLLTAVLTSLPLSQVQHGDQSNIPIEGNFATDGLVLRLALELPFTGGIGTSSPSE
jgi:hypothetical protein